MVKAYIRDIESKTGLKLHKSQIEQLKNALRYTVYDKLSPGDTAAYRAEFTQKVKNACIAEWEKNTGQKWPTYAYPVYDKNGKIVRNVGDLYDAHHVIENCYGGDHAWWNMHPAKFPDEHQGGVHGKGSPARELYK